MSPSNAPIRYVATLHHVREVSLHGTADLGFWTAALDRESLVPTSVDNRAQIQILAADARFKGLRFCEVSICVRVNVPDRGSAEDAVFLVQAFNSRRFFAFCERNFFHTPYLHADCHCSANLPLSIRLGSRSEDGFWAHMQRDTPAVTHTATRARSERWNGPVFLPTRAGFESARSMFFADLSGDCQAYPFVPSDKLLVRPMPRIPVLQQLIDSQFEADQWIVRHDARHAKSKTYRRPV